MPHNRNMGDNREEWTNPDDVCCIEAARIDKDGRFYFELPHGGRRYLDGREDGTK
jgi:hypothetical protein